MSVSDTGEIRTGTVALSCDGKTVTFAKASLVVEAIGTVKMPCHSAEDHEFDTSASGCFPITVGEFGF